MVQEGGPQAALFLFKAAADRVALAVEAPRFQRKRKRG